MRLETTAADDLVNAFAASLSGGTLVIYAGPRPTTAGTAGLQRVLVRYTLPAPAFMAATNGAALSYPFPLGIIEDTGTAVWAQWVTAAGQVRADLSVGTEDSNDVVLTNADLERNGTVEVTSATLRLPLGAA
jgi:hypothetical protein